MFTAKRMTGAKDSDLLYWATDQSKPVIPSEALKKKTKRERIQVGLEIS